MSRYGDVYVVTTSPGNVDKLDNGFRLHGGGGVYLAESTADIGSDPYMYWQGRQAVAANLILISHINYLIKTQNIITTQYQLDLDIIIIQGQSRGPSVVLRHRREWRGLQV